MAHTWTKYCLYEDDCYLGVARGSWGWIYHGERPGIGSGSSVLRLRLVLAGPQPFPSRTSPSPSRSLSRTDDVGSVFPTSCCVSSVYSVPQLRINLTLTLALSLTLIFCTTSTKFMPSPWKCFDLLSTSHHQDIFLMSTSAKASLSKDGPPNFAFSCQLSNVSLITQKQQGSRSLPSIPHLHTCGNHVTTHKK